MKINYETNNNFFYQTQVCCVGERAVENEEDEATYVEYEGHKLKCSYRGAFKGIPDVIIENMFDQLCVYTPEGFRNYLSELEWIEVLINMNFKIFFDKHPIK